MARQKNDGKGRIGGRAKGTPNKVTASLREFIKKMIDDNREQIIADIAVLEPKERLMILERLMSYVLPKKQDINANLDNDICIGFIDCEYKPKEDEADVDI